MTKTIKEFISIVIAALFVFAGGMLTGRAQTADPIQSIRQQYAAINKRVPALRKVKRRIIGFSLEGGDLVAYLDGPAVVKIVANHYGEGGKTMEEYYYASGKLIFVFERVSRYDQPLSGKVVSTEESRFYFSNDKLIRWVDGSGKQMPSNTEEYAEQQSEHLESSNTFVDLARSKTLAPRTTRNMRN